jgi:hypothetical protein
MAAMGGVTLLALLFSLESFVTNFASSMMGGGDRPARFQINFAKNFVPNLWLWWLFAMVTLGMLFSVVNGKMKSAVLVYALIVMGAIDAVKVDSLFIKTDSPRKYIYQNDPALSELKGEFAKAPFRIFAWPSPGRDKQDNPLPGTFPMENQEGVYGLESVSGFHDNELNCYLAFRGQGDINYLQEIAIMNATGLMVPSMVRIIGNTPFLDLANVEYILIGVGPGSIINKAKNPSSLGRLSYASDFVVIEEDRIIDALKSRAYNYRTTVALLEEPELPFIVGADGNRPVGEDDNIGNADDSDIGADGADSAAVDKKSVDNVVSKKLKVDWKKYTTNERIANITMPADGFLRISEVYYPGWRIKANGEDVKYYRSDMAWMAVPLKAGDYEVVMTPKSLYLGDAAWVTLISALFVVAVLGYGFMRRKRPV